MCMVIKVPQLGKQNMYHLRDFFQQEWLETEQKEIIIRIVELALFNSHLHRELSYMWCHGVAKILADVDKS